MNLPLFGYCSCVIEVKLLLGNFIWCRCIENGVLTKVYKGDEICLKNLTKPFFFCLFVVKSNTLVKMIIFNKTVHLQNETKEKKAILF